MKKILALIIALAMILSMSVTAFADETDTTTTAGAKAGSDTLVGPLDENYTGTKDDNVVIDAYGRLDSDGDGVPDDNDDTPTSNITISVDIAWDAMEWTFTGMHRSWDPNSLQYNDNESTSWSNNVETITVTNSSNCDIVAGANFKSALGENNNFDLDISVNTTSEAINKSTSYTAAGYEAAIKLTSAAEGVTRPYYETGEKTVGVFDVAVDSAVSDGIDDDNTKVGTITVTIFKAPAETTGD